MRTNKIISPWNLIDSLYDISQFLIPYESDFVTNTLDVILVICLIYWHSENPDHIHINF